MLSKIAWSLFINFLVLISIHGQGSCSVDQIISQEEIDNFATDHPGCTSYCRKSKYHR
ncbi:MAG: hypothetical protein ACI94Y_000806 [Maribacter sp.]|jgi:hypothetical protein